MTIEEAQSFGSLLRRYRRAAGLTQESLAERAALSTRGIQDLERGVSQNPRTATIDLLAAALDLPESDRAELRHAAGRQLPVRKEAGPSHFGSPSRLVPLVGRRAELAALDHLLTGGDAGVGTVAAPLLLLAGEPGIGKTRLLQAAAQQAVGQGWSVLAGGCYRRGARNRTRRSSMRWPGIYSYSRPPGWRTTSMVATGWCASCRSLPACSSYRRGER